jgi:hypothetical protein
MTSRAELATSRSCRGWQKPCRHDGRFAIFFGKARGSRAFLTIPAMLKQRDGTSKVVGALPLSRDRLRSKKGMEDMASPAPAHRSASSELYYDHIDIYDYDETIVTHVYMDQIKASMISELIRLDFTKKKTISILDGGTGSGQLARCILGAGFSRLELADI